MAYHQYNGVCYSSNESLAKDIYSKEPMILGNHLMIPDTLQSFVEIQGGYLSVQILYLDKDITTSQISIKTIYQYYLSCDSPGPVNTITNMSVSDALEVSWSIVLVWLMAFYWKNLRIGVRGY